MSYPVYSNQSQNSKSNPQPQPQLYEARPPSDQFHVSSKLPNPTPGRFVPVPALPSMTHRQRSHSRSKSVASFQEEPSFFPDDGGSDNGNEDGSDELSAEAEGEKTEFDTEAEAKQTLEMELESISAERLNRLPVEKLEIPKEPSVKDVKLLEFVNPLSREIDDAFQRMTPLEMFMWMIDDLAKEVAKLSKEFAVTVFNDRNVQITREDIELYIFIFIYLSVYQLPSAEMLWEENKCITNVIPEFITLRQFRKIGQYLCIFRNNDDTYKEKSKVNPDKKTDKIDYIVEYFNRKWQELYPPTKYITVDEAMTGFSGGISFKQYIKDKNKRLGIKFFAKASGNRGYMYEIIPYSGKGFKYNETIGIGATIVKHMAQGHENKGFHFTLDSYYSNLYSFKYLYDNGIDFTATFVRERKALPEKIRKTTIKRGEQVMYQLKNTTIKMYIFHKVKQIQVASSCFGVEKVKYINKRNNLKYKPEMIAYYNLTKAGVDLVDCATQIYKTQRRTVKWWKAVFFYVIDITMNNCKIAYIASTKYRQFAKNQNGALFFRKILINQFIEYFHPGLMDEKCLLRAEQKAVAEIRPKKIYAHFDHYPKLVDGPPQTCYFCKVVNSSAGKVLNKSRFVCSACKVIFCPDCFRIFHQRRLYEKLSFLKLPPMMPGIGAVGMNNNINVKME